MTGATGPLTGLRVLVPRSPERASALVGALRDAGAEPVVAPLVRITAPGDTVPLDAALVQLGEGVFEWLAVTSGFAVDALAARAGAAGRTLAEVLAAGRGVGAGGTRVAAVGDATAAALRGVGVEADFVPVAEHSARGMLAEWPPPHRGTVLLPQGDLAEPTLAEGLAALGFRTDVVVAYRNAAADPLPPGLVADLRSGAVGAVVLTSGSTARRLAEQVALPAGTLVCCIGPRTAEVATALGLPTGPVAASPDPRAVVDALTRAAAALRPHAPPTPR